MGIIKVRPTKVIKDVSMYRGVSIKQHVVKLILHDRGGNYINSCAVVVDQYSYESTINSTYIYCGNYILLVC